MRAAHFPCMVQWIVVVVLGVVVTGAASAGNGRIQIASVVDESRAGEAVHRANTAIVKQALAGLIAQEHDGGDIRLLDIAVTSLHVATMRDNVVVSAKVRVTITGDDGTLMHVIAGGARVEIAKRSYHERRLPGLREDALTGAVHAVFTKVKRTLRADRA